MKIPKKFKLFGTEFTVDFDNEKMDKENAIGVSYFSSCSIVLASKDKGKPINKNVIIDSFYHEKVHTILDAMGEHKLSQNEKFVEVFSRLLRQSDETAEY